MKEAREHDPVMLGEAMEGLAIKPAGVYVDGTFGRGGHARAILDQLSERGRLVVFDKDPMAIACAEKLAAIDRRVTLFHSSFSEIKQCLSRHDLVGKIDGILLDLGVSSPQLDEAGRGFSFLQDGPLDMRMDTTTGLSAKQWIAQVKESELADVLFQYGEETHARKIAAAIVLERKKQPIVGTVQLARIIAEANPHKSYVRHGATKSFQAIRIFINHELDDLNRGLVDGLNVLAPKGRLVVISFHSLEDRIVKRFIQKNVRGDDVPAKLPITDDQRHVTMMCLGKGRRPQKAEIEQNVRSRSAVLRIGEKI